MCIKRQIEVELNITPEELAKVFCEFDCTKQAQFFNAIADEVKTWEYSFPFQMSFVSSDDALLPKGKSIMQIIGEYGDIQQ